MNREVISILEHELESTDGKALPPPIIGLDKPVSGEWIVQIIRDARDGKR
jgi:hypothetical protein